jgi:pyrroline-5-carboxylate reductase
VSCAGSRRTASRSPSPKAGRAILLVGCGKMGAALLAGWSKTKIAAAFYVVEPAAPKRIAGVRYYATAAKLPQDLAPALVVLAVKPQALDAILPDYRRFAGRATFLSIAAGKTLAALARGLGSDAAIIRAMPNTPAAIGRGITVACADARVGQSMRDLASRLLAAAGELAWVEDESLLDPVTAVSGSGPAYVFLLIEALAEAGTAAGLPAALAERLARATVAGSGELARLSTETAAQLREAVTSPGGTTRAALDVLMAPDGLKALMLRAVAAATKRSRDLAQ